MTRSVRDLVAPRIRPVSPRLNSHSAGRPLGDISSLTGKTRITQDVSVDHLTTRSFLGLPTGVFSAPCVI